MKTASKTIVQITAGLAPEEALRFVDLLAGEIVRRMKPARVTRPSAKRSMAKRSMARLEFEGLSAESRRALFALEGTHVLHDGSRGRGGRKRWFVGVLVWEDERANALRDEDVRFEYCRAGGAGGQHVNRTASAVRAFHFPSGLSVRAEGTRSQHQNRREALRLLKAKYETWLEEARGQKGQTMRRAGFAFERGNPVRAYVLKSGRLHEEPTKE